MRTKKGRGSRGSLLGMWLFLLGVGVGVLAPLQAVGQVRIRGIEQKFYDASDGGVRLGPVRVHPGVVVSQTYTDNYFLDPEGERYEWITTVSPNLRVHLPLRRHSLDFEYRSDFHENLRHTEYSVDHHYLKGGLTLDFPGGLVIKASHSWNANSNPPIFRGDDRKRFKENVSTLDATYRFSDRYSVGLTYAHAFRRFDKDRFEVDDFDRDEVVLDLNYRILPKTTVFLEGGYKHLHWPGRDFISFDSNEYRVWIGARTKPTAKIVGVLKGGWGIRVWDDDRVGGDVSIFGMEGDLYYDLTPRTRLSLVLFRHIEDTSFTTTENVAFGSSFTTTGGRFRVEQSFTRPLSAYALVGLTFNDYNEQGLVREEREDLRFHGGLGIDYRIWKWVTLGMRYDYTSNDSNYDEEEYTENRIMFYGSFGL